MLWVKRGPVKNAKPVLRNPGRRNSMAKNVFVRDGVPVPPYELAKIKDEARKDQEAAKKEKSSSRRDAAIQAWKTMRERYGPSGRRSK